MHKRALFGLKHTIPDTQIYTLYHAPQTQIIDTRAKTTLAQKRFQLYARKLQFRHAEEWESEPGEWFIRITGAARLFYLYKIKTYPNLPHSMTFCTFPGRANTIVCRTQNAPSIR